MNPLPLKTRAAIMTILASMCLQAVPLSASEPITPYKETGKSGLFNYAFYNNRWLLHGKRAQEEKHITRVAITGVVPGTEGEISIPALIEGHEVYGIDERAFDSCQGITGITIPGTVRFLQPGTLNRCQGLQNIVVADDHPEFASVDGVMFDKQKTKLLAVGSGRAGHYEAPDATIEIGPGAFSHCAELKSIRIPEGVTDIGGHSGSVFQGCTNLERIDIPDSVTNIGQKSFQDCSKLREVVIPPKLTTIPFGLFWRCSNLTKITLPDGITSIGNYAFADCTNITLQAFPEDLTKIGAYAFKDCTSLKGLTVPDSVTIIARGAFRGCDVKGASKPDAVNGNE